MFSQKSTLEILKYPWRGTFILASALPFLLANFVFAQFSGDDLEFFENRVRPILSQRCAECHLTENEPGEGGFSIDSRASILEGGDSGPAIVPGDPQKSLLIDSVHYRGHYEMPPDSKLPADEIKILEEWVQRNAPWPNHSKARKKVSTTFNLQARRDEHWAWQKLTQQTPPNVIDAQWPANEIDHFVLAKLETAGYQPAASADKRTWIRRAYHDLIGLPPPIEAVREFEKDDSPNAYEKVVDELLFASPHFGERWARHWMDLIRYAETYGHEFDYPIHHAHQYRDYLIRAFNADVPYDDFIREHIAGDLLENPRLHKTEKYNEAIIGTRFWFLGEATHGPVNVREDEAGRVDNQIDVMSKTFLGMTVACARCHDHKFDAISIDDYYALSGFLQSSRRQIALLDPHNRINNAVSAAKVEYQKHQDLPKEFMYELASVDSESWLQQIKAAGPTQDTAINAVDENFSCNFKALSEHRFLEDELHPLHLLRSAVNVEEDETLLKFKCLKMEKQWTTRQKQYANFQSKSKLLEDFSNGLPDNWFGEGWAFERPTQTLATGNFSASGNAIGFPGTINSGLVSSKMQGVLRSPTFEITHDKIAIRAKSSNCKIRLVIDGFIMFLHNPLLFNGCNTEPQNSDNFDWIVLDADVKNYKGHMAYLEFIDHGDSFINIDEIRLVDNGIAIVDPPSEFARNILERKPKSRLQLQAALAKSFNELANLGLNEMSNEQAHILGLLIDYVAFSQPLKDAQDAVSMIKIPSPLKAIAITDGSPENEYLFVRGNSEILGPKIPRRFLSACTPTLSADAYIGSGRLQLANQIASSQNPLTARVIVNRIWHHLIGQGIVASVDNFGVLGEEPTHPELLDYLAASFIADGWSIKRLIRKILLSSTYRMASINSAEIETKDPENKLLHRANIKRLSGEAIRDSILRSAGTLDDDMFGKSVPIHLTQFMQGRGRPRGSGPLDGKGRRSIYIEVRRNFLSPMMLAFDTPIPFNTIGKRHQSNVPAQALILMNDPFIIDQARKWSEKLVAAALDRDKRINSIFEAAFARSATETEMESAKQFLMVQSQERKLPKDQINTNVELWADLCHIIFNMKEFIYID